MTAPNLSLYQIETELLDLLRFREETAADPEANPQELVESLKAVDNQIREYVTREVQKADGIAAYLRECETRAAALKLEVKRVTELARMWEQRGERLKTVTKAVMQAMGKKVIEGRASVLKLAKNPASVDVAQPNLVPEQYMRASVTLSLDLWHRLLAHLMTTEKGAPLFGEMMELKLGDAQPMLAKIKDELKAGVGVPGCRLIDDKTRLEIK